MPFRLYQNELYIAGLLLCITNLLFTFLQRRTDKIQNKLYILMNIVIALNAGSVVISSYAWDYKLTSEAAFFAERFAQFSYFLFHQALGPMFAFYVLYASGMEHRVTKVEQFLWAAPFVISELMLITNPFTHWMYTFDENRDFQRNWGEYLVYGCCIIYFIFGFITLIFSWKSLTWKRRIAMGFFFFVVAAGVLIQMLYYELPVELFAESLGMMGVMIAIEAEDDRIDSDTGFYNRRALIMDVSALLMNRKRFAVICIKVTNPEIIQRATGSQNQDLLAQILSEYLKSIVKRYYIYNVTSDSFLLRMVEKTEEDIKPLAQEISARFETPFSYNGTDIPLTAVVITADVPGCLHTADDVLAMTDQPIPKRIKQKVLCGKDLDYLVRRVAVGEAVSRGLKEHNFEVYYQPTYHIDGTLHGAEALIRLHDPVLGSIFPDEFVPVAEQIGMIDLLDNFVFSEVCRFWQSGIPSKYGMDCINVNLSVMQCMQPGFVDQINTIAESAGIDKSRINFEITESVAATDYNVLSGIISGLKREGYHFSMDDYGTGYSNMESIFSLDFDVVKIDKSILWSAEKGGVGRIVLESTVHMIQQMKREILVEGVETQTQIDMLRKLGVDYLQGYFFSQPVPVQEFVRLISDGKERYPEPQPAEVPQEDAEPQEAAASQETAEPQENKEPEGN